TSSVHPASPSGAPTAGPGRYDPAPTWRTYSVTSALASYCSTPPCSNRLEVATGPREIGVWPVAVKVMSRRASSLTSRAGTVPVQCNQADSTCAPAGRLRLCAVEVHVHRSPGCTRHAREALEVSDCPAVVTVAARKGVTVTRAWPDAAATPGALT